MSDFYDLYGIPWNRISLCSADKLPFVEKGKKKLKREGFTHRDVSIGMFRSKEKKGGCIRNEERTDCVNAIHCILPVRRI